MQRSELDGALNNRSTIMTDIQSLRLRGIAIHAFDSVAVFAQNYVIFYKTGSFTNNALL